MSIDLPIATEYASINSCTKVPLSGKFGPQQKRLNARIEEVFTQQVTRRPEATAVIYGTEAISFKALNDGANRLAHALIDAGLQPGAKVGVLVNRSALLPKACLAIYKAGAIYVPLVNDHPADRLAYMLAEAAIEFVIALDGLELPAKLSASISLLRPENIDLEAQYPVHAPSQTSPPDTDLAAVLFTSGSTGYPKGVELSHAAVINMVLGHVEQQGILCTDRILLASSPGFILGFREVHLTFFSGAAHVAITRADLDQPRQLIEIMERHCVSFALLTPSYLRLFEGKIPKGLNTLITAGEPPDIEVARHYAAHLNYWNCHGSTETCGTYCMRQISANEQAPISSGTPFPNTTVLLLDDDGEPVDEGEIANIYVIGAGLASGYLNRPDLSDEHFLETRWGRAYNTKDLGRWNAKGELIALGRIDDVVKINAQSVTLSEIEHALKCHDNVSHAVALLVDGRLTAAVETNLMPAPGVDYWRGFLANRLPHYMIPGHLVCIEKIPVSSSGKADRMKISDLATTDFNDRDIGTPPKGLIEIALASAWSLVLCVPGICREDNFFSLGGDSLGAIQVSLKLRDAGYDLPPHGLLATPILKQQAQKARRRLDILSIDDDSGYASTMQRDFWTAWKLGRVQSGLVISRVLVVTGQVPTTNSWCDAWQTLFERHPGLRTEFFEEHDDTLRWRVNPHAEVDFSVVSAATEDIARRYLDEVFAKPIALDRAPLVHAGLINLAESQKTLFWFVLHHCVVDGLSAQVLQNELFDLLCNRPLPKAGNGPALASRLERDHIDSIVADDDRAFWRKILDNGLQCQDGEAFSDYAIDLHRPMQPSGQATQPFYQHLTPEQVTALEQLARLNGVGIHSLLLALLAHETRRRTGKQTVIIGSTITNQPAGEEAVVGLFVNLLPTVLSKGESCSNLTDEFKIAQNRIGEVGEHAQLPAAYIVAAFRARHPEIRSRRSNLFDISFTANPSRYNHRPDSSLTFKLWRRSSDTLPPAAGMELAFHHEMLADGSLELGLSWDPDVYYEETAKDWLFGFADWARWVATDLTRAARPLPALLPKEAELLRLWENGPVKARQPKRFNELFSMLAAESPDKMAVIGQHQIINRSQLETEANRIAHGLIAKQVRPGDVVAVLTGCNLSLASVILGIWKVGAVYLPLALDVPSERQAYIAEDAGVHILIAVEGAPVSAALSCKITHILHPENMGARTIERETAAVICVAVPQDTIAYIIYTSGTTGRPKGVICRHDSLINVVQITNEAIGFSPEDRVAMVASPGFDASIWELGMGLLLGAALVPIEHTLRDDPWAMKRYYQEFGVSVAFHAPSYMRISRDTPFDSLRVLITGGEAPSHEDFAALPLGLRFFNAYGPTETTIIACLSEITSDTVSHRALPVGRPSANQRIVIRRQDGTPLPPGVLGEIWLGGMGVGNGYLHQHELTAKQFIETPEGLHYRTGDLGRWTPDAKLELAGRIDHQVKLHGQRLELEEIELAIAELDQVAEAVVLLHQSVANTTTLRAFIRLKQGVEVPQLEAWRAVLGNHLPPYMLPADMTVVDSIPVTHTGKLDREALLSLPLQSKQHSKMTAPLSGLETIVAEVWHDLLVVDVHREDNFFALGGNSLLAVTIAHRLSKQLNQHVVARDLFAAPTLSRFTEKVAASEPFGQHAVQRTNVATEGEREFWTAEKAGLDTRTFIILAQQKVCGEAPLAKEWDQAWQKVVTRHGALRTYYREDAEGILRRRLASHSTAKLTHTVVADPAALNMMVRKWQSEPLQMETSPLWRAGVITERETGSSTFWLAMHHGVGDGRSVGILMHDMAALLDGATLATPKTDLDQTGATYNAYLDGPIAKQDREYWQSIMRPVPDLAFQELPLDQLRENTELIGTHRIKTTIDPDTAQGLLQLASKHEASLHALMLSLLALETRRRTGRNAFILGTTASSRETTEDNEVVGCFVNMLPLPYALPDNISFGDLLKSTQQDLMEALVHERFPFAQIYHDVWAERPDLRHPLRFPLFDLVVTENPTAEFSSAIFPRQALVGDTLEYEFTPWPPGQDMVLMHERQLDGSLMLEWHVNAEVYQRSTSQAWFQALVSWARWLGEDPLRANAQLPALLPEEALRISGYETGLVIARPARCVHEVFEEHVALQPDATAILSGDNTLSYDGLDRAANRIAHALLASGLTPGAVVAVLSERTPQLASAMLGIWKAGGVYLPLAADLPDSRLGEMAKVSAAKILLILDNHPAMPLLTKQITTLLRPENFPQDLPETKPSRVLGSETAYILFTSGSTGRPKGTRIGHSAYFNLVMGMVEEYAMSNDDRTLMFSSPSFDVSLSDIGVPLAAGAALCPVSLEILSAPNKLVELIAKLRITVVDLTPTYLRLLSGAALPSVRILVTGGEAPFADDVATYAKCHRYYNAYGPTENTITSCLGLLSAEPNALFNCGRPLPNTLIEIRGPNAQRVPVGVTGELWLGGHNLAEGYINRPQETAKAFVFTDEGRRYRTGDLGRWREDGQLELFGRVDEQVKLNGIRVEISEIEAVISIHPAVSQTVVVVEHRPDRSHKLFAFVRPQPNCDAPAPDFWPDYLRSRLPAYMIPAAVIQVDAIPVNHAGKIDKRALLGALETFAVNESLTLPSEALDCIVANVWCLHLGCDVVHLEDNFFFLGGHSLLAIAVANDLEKQLNYPVPARVLFMVPTLAGFSECVRLAAKNQPINATSSDVASEGQQEFWIAEQAGHDTRGFNLALTLQVKGDNPPRPKAWADAWKQLLKRHSALRSSFWQDPDGRLRSRINEHITHRFDLSRARDFASAREQIVNAQAEPFSMSNGPLWRAGLVLLENTDTIFWLALHHAIGDGWSLGILAQELEAVLRGNPLQAALQKNQQTPPHLCQIQAAQEFDYLNSPDADHDRHYWQQTLSKLAAPDGQGSHAFDEWPLDMSRPARRKAKGSKGSHCLRVRLDVATVDGLRSLAQRNGATMHTVILTLMALEINRRTDREDFVLGTVASRRESNAEAAAVGYYINMLPVVCNINGATPVDTAIAAMQRNLADALKHQRYPFACISRDFSDIVGATRHPTRLPVFDFAVTENPAVQASDLSDDWWLQAPQVNQDDVIGYELRPAGPAQDMVLIHEARNDGGLDLILFVNANIYQQSTAQAWLDAISHWIIALGQAVLCSSQALPALTPEEARWLANRHGEQCIWPVSTFHDAFSLMARNYPEHPALITECSRISYQDMDRLTDILARRFISAGAMRGRAVGVLTDRSIKLPQTALAIFKTGAVYLPLTVSLPKERLAFMCEDADPALLIVLDGHPVPDKLSHIPVLRPETSNGSQPLPAIALPDFTLPAVSAAEVAYILYTSGSTGTPKGVVITHQGWNNFAHGVAAKLDISQTDCLLLSASPSFDGWLSDLGMCWASGGAVFPITRDQMNDLEDIKHNIERFGITHATLPPSYLRLFNQAHFPSLKSLMTVGEPPLATDVAHYAANLAYYNGYGPTENTGATSIGGLSPELLSLNAGTPIANVTVYILNDHQQPVAPGVLGHIWTGGQSLAQCYLNLPDKTKEAFVDTEFGRLYHTGDLGRWTVLGMLEVVGRADTQVKLRGQRVELGEIEARLEQYQDVRQAVALVETSADGIQILWAFINLAPKALEPSQSTWQRFLGEHLPSYMIPAAVISVAQIPVNLAGKLDQQALLQHVTELKLFTDGYDSINRTPPASETEIRVAELWKIQFPDRKIAREDDFFALGGDSLRVIAVINMLRSDYQCSVNNLYENPVLADFALCCQRRPEHLQQALKAAKADWQKHIVCIEAYEDELEQTLAQPLADYHQRNLAYDKLDLSVKHHYSNVLLTGATGYLGAYLLKELLQELHGSQLLSSAHTLTVLVRDADETAARARLDKVLQLYFGAVRGHELANDARLRVFAADLRQPNLGLSEAIYQRLGGNIDAIYHCAANVNHFGHYHELYASNVTATQHLLDLAATRTASPADFHHVSTISVVGNAPETGFELFSEYTPSPEQPANNYYIRTKQEAERLVVAARHRLRNATIHRVGNVVFAAEHPVLQKGVKTNAFFRQLASFIQIGKAPDDMHVWLCHVDYLAKALVSISQPQILKNETHHLEHHHRHAISELLNNQGTAIEGVKACGFSEFLDRLMEVVDDPQFSEPLAELVEAFGLIRGRAPQPRGRRLEVITERTQSLLCSLGFVWPEVPITGLKHLLSNAQDHFCDDLNITK